MLRTGLWPTRVGIIHGDGQPVRRASEPNPDRLGRRGVALPSHVLHGVGHQLPGSERGILHEFRQAPVETRRGDVAPCRADGRRHRGESALPRGVRVYPLLDDGLHAIIDGA